MQHSASEANSAMQNERSTPQPRVRCGLWRIRRAPVSTSRQSPIRYTLTVDINMPMISMFKRKAEKTIIDGALKGLKKRVEG